MIPIKQPVGNWQNASQFEKINQPDDVRVVQQLLIDVSQKLLDSRFRPRCVNGLIAKPPQSSSTVQAITQFQAVVLGTARQDGRIDPGRGTWNGLVAIKESTGFEFLENLDIVFKPMVSRFIAKFGAVAITSGKRTVVRQAELMAPMSNSDLDMYGATSAYVVKIKALSPAQRTAAKVKEILDEAIGSGSKVSDHLQGKAVDIAAAGGFNWSVATTVANQIGLKSKQETSRNCFHISI
jgi:hypothetical protein